MAAEPTRGQTLLIIAVLTVIGSVLRFYHLNFQSLWYDELHSIIPTDPANSLASIVEYCKTDQPPAFFLYLHYTFKIFGYSEIVGRTAAAFIGILCIPATFLLGRECKNKMVGLAAALIVTFNYFSIYYSQELRFYSFAFLFATLSFMFFIRALKHGKAFDYVGYILTSSILLYTHYFGIVIYVTQVIIFGIVCVIVKPKTDIIIKSFIAGLAVALTFIPWLPVVFGDLQIGQFWIQKPKPLFLAEYFYLYLGKDIILTLLFVGFLIIFFRENRFKRTNKDFLVVITLVLWLLLSYAIPLIRSLVSTPVLHVRYTIVTLPAWIILFAWGWTLVPGKKVTLMLAGVIAVSSIINLIFLRGHYNKISKQQFREAAEIVIAKNEEKLPVVSTFPWHYNFYFRSTTSKVGYDATVTSETTKFWLLPVQTFSPTEIENEIAKFPQFEIAERHVFNKTQALLMVRKPQ